MKKLLLLLFTMIISWGIPILIYELEWIIYKIWFSPKRDISWGIFIHYLFFYYNLLGLLIATGLYFIKKKGLFLPPFVILAFTIYIGIEVHPFRWLLIIAPILVSYIILFFTLKSFKKAQ